jgi:hypothetical protein
MFVALHCLYLETWICGALVKASGGGFNVAKGPLGRFIWLTHQGIGLVAIHSVASVLTPFFSVRLALGTYRLAVLVGGLASFITIQFFILVFFTPAFSDECKLWEALGVDCRFLEASRHAPPLMLAIADVCFLRHRDTLLRATPGVTMLVCAATGYCLFYTALTHANRCITGCWPYAFMDDFGDSALGWAKFVLIQSIIISGFVLMLDFVAWWTWTLW